MKRRRKRHCTDSSRHDQGIIRRGSGRRRQNHGRRVRHRLRGDRLERAAIALKRRSHQRLQRHLRMAARGRVREWRGQPRGKRSDRRLKVRARINEGRWRSRRRRERRLMMRMSMSMIASRSRGRGASASGAAMVNITIDIAMVGGGEVCPCARRLGTNLKRLVPRGRLVACSQQGASKASVETVDSLFLIFDSIKFAVCGKQCTMIENIRCQWWISLPSI